MAATAMGASGAVHALAIDKGGHLFNPCGRLSAELRNHELTQAGFAGLNMQDVWDCHVHLIGAGDSGSGAWFSPKMRSLLHPGLYAQYRFYLNASCVDASRKNVDLDFRQRLLTLLDDFPAGFRAMAMAFDLAHDEMGKEDREHSAFYVPNDYAAGLAAQHPQRLMFTASVHPYREDAAEALRAAAAKGAVAVKWLPSAMNIDPASPRCDRFYQAMAALDLPLITHGGEEKAVDGAARQDLGNVLRLRRALDAGVRVVVAHCASHGTDRDLDTKENHREVQCFTLFERLMADPSYRGRLFGDVSAIPQTNRMDTLPRILGHEEWRGRLLNGSDYPLPGVFPLFSVDALTKRGWLKPPVGEHLKRIREGNPLLFDFLLKRHLKIEGHSFGNEVFETARVFRRAAPASIYGK